MCWMNGCMKGKTAMLSYLQSCRKHKTSPGGRHDMCALVDAVVNALDSICGPPSRPWCFRGPFCIQHLASDQADGLVHACHTHIVVSHGTNDTGYKGAMPVEVHWVVGHDTVQETGSHHVIHNACRHGNFAEVLMWVRAKYGWAESTSYYCTF